MEAPTDELAIRVGVDGVTVYMTREAMQRLVSDLNRVLEADPSEFYETHVGMLFSSFAADGTYRTPHVSFEDGLGAIISEKREAHLRASIEAGEADADMTPAPFEVTLMHVSREVVEKAAALPDE